MSNAIIKFEIEGNKSLIKAIKDGIEPIEIKFRIGHPEGIIRGFDIIEVFSSDELEEVKKIIISHLDRKIQSLMSKLE